MTRRARRILIALALTMCTQLAARAQPPPVIDAETGAAAIRLFERDPTLALPVPRRGTSSRRESLVYSLHDGRRYEVDLHTGQVWRVGYFGTESPRGAKGKISAQQAEEIARRYGTEHFPSFMQNLLKTSVHFGGDMFGVYFQQQAPASGALLPNWLSVDVNAKSGDVYLAALHDEASVPVGVDQTPGVSELQAISRAAEAAGMIRVREVQHSSLRWARHNGDRLVWSLQLDGVFPTEIHGIRIIAVDAQTGNIISVQKPESPDYRIKKGPDGPEIEFAVGPSVPAVGSVGSTGGSSAGGLSPGSLAALGSLLVLALAAGAIHLLRRRRSVTAGGAESPI